MNGIESPQHSGGYMVIGQEAVICPFRQSRKFLRAGILCPSSLCCSYVITFVPNIY